MVHCLNMLGEDKKLFLLFAAQSQDTFRSQENTHPLWQDEAKFTSTTQTATKVMQKKQVIRWQPTVRIVRRLRLVFYT